MPGAPKKGCPHGRTAFRDSLLYKSELSDDRELLCLAVHRVDDTDNAEDEEGETYKPEERIDYRREEPETYEREHRADDRLDDRADNAPRDLGYREDETLIRMELRVLRFLCARI